MALDSCAMAPRLSGGPRRTCGGSGGGADCMASTGMWCAASDSRGVTSITSWSVPAASTPWRPSTGSRTARRRNFEVDVVQARGQLPHATRRIAALVRQLTDVDVQVDAILITHGQGWPWHANAAWRHADDVVVLRGNHAHRWRRILPDTGLAPSDVSHDRQSPVRLVRRAASNISAYRLTRPCDLRDRCPRRAPHTTALANEDRGCLRAETMNPGVPA